MALRVARGLFRLWLVLSVLWTGGVGIVTWWTFPVDDWVYPSGAPAPSAGMCDDLIPKGNGTVPAFDPSKPYQVFRDKERRGAVQFASILAFAPPAFVLALGSAFGTEPGRAQEAGMNVSRGLFRAWILVTVLWCIVIAALAYNIVHDKVSHWKWQYVHQMRKDIEPWKVDWTRPYYENMRSPSVEKRAVNFSELGYEYVAAWSKHVTEGTMTTNSFPDGSLLYLNTDLTEADQQYLAQAFWHQRWWRYAEIGKKWAAILTGRQSRCSFSVGGCYGLAGGSKRLAHSSAWSVSPRATRTSAPRSTQSVAAD
jgi:hypothetical protein